MSRGPKVLCLTITVPVSPEQKHVIQQGAIATGESVGRFMRRVALKEAVRESILFKQAA